MNQRTARKLMIDLAAVAVEREAIIEAIKASTGVSIFDAGYEQANRSNARELADALNRDVKTVERKDGLVHCEIEYAGMRIVWLEEE